MDNKDQAKGKIEKAAGELTDDRDLKRKGDADKKAGDAKEMVSKAGDKANDLIDRAKKALTKD